MYATETDIFEKWNGQVQNDKTFKAFLNNQKQSWPKSGNKRFWQDYVYFCIKFQTSLAYWKKIFLHKY